MAANFIDAMVSLVGTKDVAVKAERGRRVGRRGVAQRKSSIKLMGSKDRLCCKEGVEGQ